MSTLIPDGGSNAKAPAGDPAQAQKKDFGKAPMWRGLMQYFPAALRGVAEISAFGFVKYGSWGGWRQVPGGRERYEDALLRHTEAIARGEFADPESGKPHSWHRAWNALAIAELDGYGSK